MEKKIKALFDYQAFENNVHLSKIIRHTERSFAKELGDEELAFVNAAGDLSTNNINWEVFAQTLINSGALDVPALAELTSYAMNKSWQQLAIILPKFLTNPIVMDAFNAALQN